ncbi:MAG: outer membrane protein [Kiritimatiellia bacterium]
MKKGLIGLMVLACAGSALAQLAGLPIAGGAAAPAGRLQGSGGVVLGDDFNTYGVRVAYAPIEGLAVFGDAGLLDPDEGDMGWAIQGGGLFVLPVDLPVDVGVRGTIGYGGFDFDEAGVEGDATLLTLNGGVLASKTVDRFTPYAFVGVNYADTEVDVEGYGDESEDETDLAIAAGTTFALNEQLSFYGEIAHIDDVFFGLGARYAF